MQIWNPNDIFEFFKNHPEGEQLCLALPSGIYCTENIAWCELLANQRSAPSLAILENLHAITNRLQAYRDTIFENKPIIITSAWREIFYNKKIGGAPFSKHLTGQAVDFCVKNMPPSKVQLLLKNHKGGLGAYKNFTHIDTGKTRRW